MSRGIKFRGKATCSNRWAYGSYVECDGGYYIIEKLGGDEGDVAKIQVFRESIEQYTGRKDKNKGEIYEGDSLRTPGGQILKVEISDLINGDGKFRSIVIEECEIEEKSK